MKRARSSSRRRCPGNCPECRSNRVRDRPARPGPTGRCSCRASNPCRRHSSRQPRRGSRQKEARRGEWEASREIFFAPGRRQPTRERQKKRSPAAPYAARRRVVRAAASAGAGAASRRVRTARTRTGSGPRPTSRSVAAPAERPRTASSSCRATDAMRPWPTSQARAVGSRKWAASYCEVNEP